MWIITIQKSLLNMRIHVYICIAVFISLIYAYEAFALNNNHDGGIVIADRHQAKAVIVINDDASRQLKDAATELSKYVRLSTGVEIKIIKNTETKTVPNMVFILIKKDGRQNEANIYSYAFAENFAIFFPDRNTIVISGTTDWGVEFAVYEFLERYVGIRWLMPGPSGTFIPKHDKLSVIMRNLEEKPAFISRLLSGLKGQDQYLWARRNRMHGQVKFHHNLFNLFPPSKYAKTHQEFFPLINGKRYIPEDNTQHQWQPCFSAPGLVDEAVKNISEYFSEHPEESSYSLGVNDSGGYCECPACLALNGDAKNFLGLRNMSEQYFQWANAVAEGVLKKHPDKWFGCLAYSEVAAPPSKVKVHPRIIPFMTYDRMKWVDHLREIEGKGMTKRWHQQSSILGWYDYIYGTPYLVPRVYFHKMADYYKFGYENGVRAMYAEAYPNWGEGPKLYLALKLQWDPYLDTDKLLNEWYDACVGKEASPYLKAYYEIWEKFWTQKAPTTKWFSIGFQYLRFYEAGYVDRIDDEIVRSRKLLEKVGMLARTTEQKKRADLIMKAFEYYEASVISYQLKQKCGSFSTWPSSINCNLFQKMKERRQSLLNAFEVDPVLVHPSRYDQWKTLQW